VIEETILLENYLIIIVVVIIRVALPSSVDLGLSRGPAPLLSILCPHSSVSDDYHLDFK
jgi:hypothetical protein